MALLEIERGDSKFVINQEPLDKVLQWISYPISQKKYLLNRLHNATMLLKFVIKYGFWQFKLSKSINTNQLSMSHLIDMNGLLRPSQKRVVSELVKKKLNNILNPNKSFPIIQIDDVLIYFESIEQYFKHLDIFLKVIKHNRLVVF